MVVAGCIPVWKWLGPALAGWNLHRWRNWACKSGKHWEVVTRWLDKTNVGYQMLNGNLLMVCCIKELRSNWIQIDPTAPAPYSACGHGHIPRVWQFVSWTPERNPGTWMQQGSTGGISFLPKVKQWLKFLYHLIIIYGEVVVKSWKCAHRYTLVIFRHAAKTWLFQDVSSRYTVYVGYDVPSSMAATKAHSTDKPRFSHGLPFIHRRIDTQSV